MDRCGILTGILYSTIVIFFKFFATKEDQYFHLQPGLRSRSRLIPVFFVGAGARNGERSEQELICPRPKCLRLEPRNINFNQIHVKNGVFGSSQPFLKNLEP